MSEQEKTCFVISPIGDEGSAERLIADQVLKYIIIPAVRNYTVIRADKISTPSLITTDIIQQLINADLVVADLTNHNPNVFYELAIRHAIRKPVIQIILSGQKIPFDISQIRTIQFDPQNLDSVDNCKEEIEKQILALENNPQDFDNPISTAIDIQTLRKSDKPLEKSIADILALLQGISTKINSPIEQDTREVIATSYVIPPGDLWDSIRTIEDIIVEREIAAEREQLSVLIWWGSEIETVEGLEHILRSTFPRCDFHFIVASTDDLDSSVLKARIADLILAIDTHISSDQFTIQSLGSLGHILHTYPLVKYKTYLITSYHQYNSFPRVLPDRFLLENLLFYTPGTSELIERISGIISAALVRILRSKA